MRTLLKLERSKNARVGELLSSSAVEKPLGGVNVITDPAGLELKVRSLSYYHIGWAQ